MADPSISTNGSEEAAESPNQIVVVDLGKKQKRKRVKRLRKGRGALFDRVKDLVADLQEEGAIAADAQPVVIVVREKSRNPLRLKF